MRRILSAALLAAAAACAPQKTESVLPPATFLTPEGAHQPTSAFSPDGKRVAYWAAGDSGWELRVAPAENLAGSRLLARSQDFDDHLVWAPDGKRIAFSSNAASFLDVWATSPDSGAPVRVTTAAGTEWPAQWHPKDGRLAYVATEEGGALRMRIATPGNPATNPMLAEPRSALGWWSPDGASVAYFVIEGSRTSLWVSDSAGARQLTSEGLESFDGDGSPWSPDGTQLVYVSRRTGTGDLWTIAAAGGGVHQLTHDIRDDYQPAWSADGKWIAFVSDRGRQTDVWVIPSTGGTEQRITDDEAAESHLQWIGPSHRLAFHTGKRTRVLVRINAEDGSEQQITPDSVEVSTFDVSPDGTQLVYGAALGGGVGEIRTLPMAGGAARTLVPGPAANADPYYSPDGTKILYFSNRSGSSDAWVVDAAGGTPKALTTWPSDETDAEWSADSKTVYFLSGRDGGTLKNIYNVGAGGGDPTQLTSAGAFYNVFKVSVNGGDPVQLTASGTVQNVEPSRGNSAVYYTGLGRQSGQVVLGQAMSDGKLKLLWDKSNVTGLSHRRMSPSGDSLALQIEQPGGGLASVILSVMTGTVTPILTPQESPGAWSPDGKKLIYYVGSPNADLGVMDVATGATKRLTTTSAHEGSSMWTPDSKSIVVLRSSPRRRIATVDVASLLAGTGKK